MATHRLHLPHNVQTNPGFKEIEGMFHLFMKGAGAGAVLGIVLAASTWLAAF